MQKQFYPVIGTEIALPFYIIGIGVSCWQFPVSRPEGYDYPQLFVCIEGEGEVTVDGKTVKIMPDSIFYIPPHCPHEYRALSHSWYLDWVCFDGKQALELLKEWDLNKFHVFLNCGAERMHKLFDSAYYTIKSDKAYGNYYASA
ncbi:cupin domain-containing protein, partial [Ruminococcus bicirculans (ex Wegman et al. 2014)]|uniref:cupin domain-containing protein n=2 Tax=Oscillospiraceae TaxID=216572 RepID=UPI00366DABB6